MVDDATDVRRTPGGDTPPQRRSHALFGYDVFISYRRGDASAYAATLALKLHERQDLVVFLDDQELGRLLHGEKWHTELGAIADGPGQGVLDAIVRSRRGLKRRVQQRLFFALIALLLMTLTGLCPTPRPAARRRARRASDEDRSDDRKTLLVTRLRSDDRGFCTFADPEFGHDILELRLDGEPVAAAAFLAGARGVVLATADGLYRWFDAAVTAAR